MTTDNIIRLLQLYLIGEISREEQQELDDWCNEKEENRLFFQQILEEDILVKEHELYRDTDVVSAIHAFKQRLSIPERRHRTLHISWWKYAAILLLPLSIASVWLWQTREAGTPSPQTQQIVHGSRHAVLVLDNGKQISLASNDEKEIEVSRNVKASQQQDNLVYTPQSLEKEVQYNELRIPRGGEYKVTLSDGTLIYLNAATQLRYPVVFPTKERKVYLEGEAYFEVTKDAGRPFLVEVNGVEVKVYGTSFNISSYTTGKVQTVLVEGSVGVKILSSGEEKRIEPGEMAEFINERNDIVVKKVNTGLYTEWRNGILRFENERLEDILATLSRWYDLDIFYQNQELKDHHFTGYLGRYKDINTILSSITMATNVRFSIHERTIVVSK